MAGPNRTKTVVTNQVFHFPLNKSQDQVLQHSGIQPKDLESVTRSIESSKDEQIPLGSAIQPNELEDMEKLLENVSLPKVPKS